MHLHLAVEELVDPDHLRHAAGAPLLVLTKDHFNDFFVLKAKLDNQIFLKVNTGAHIEEVVLRLEDFVHLSKLELWDSLVREGQIEGVGPHQLSEHFLVYVNDQLGVDGYFYPA